MATTNNAGAATDRPDGTHSMTTMNPSHAAPKMAFATYRTGFGARFNTQR